jgi:hypothetical protein
MLEWVLEMTLIPHMLGLEIVGTARLLICVPRVDYFYMLCFSNFRSDNSHMELDRANEQASTDGQLFGPEKRFLR